MIELSTDLSIRQQASLLGIARSSLYYKPIINDDSELANLICGVYLDSDRRYGYRKVAEGLRGSGISVGDKKVRIMMQDMGIEGLYPRKFKVTSISDTSHKVYPYLLTGLEIIKPNQVWATDITYISSREGFLYFVAIIDLYSRYIVSYDLSHSLEASSSIMTLRCALKSAQPEIFNSDQGSQFTSTEFVQELLAHGILISMDHKGRCFDNIFVERLWRTLKQEAIYYYRPETLVEIEKCTNEFVLWYNNYRLHQALGYKTPVSLYMR